MLRLFLRSSSKFLSDRHPAICFYLQSRKIYNFGGRKVSKTFSAFTIKLNYSERSKGRARSGEQEGPKARKCDLCAKRSGIGTTNVKKTFWRRTAHDGQKWHDLIWGFHRTFFFLLIFNFLKNLVKCFIWTHILCLLVTKFSIIHDRHTSVSRWGHFLDHFFFLFCLFFAFFFLIFTN